MDGALSVRADFYHTSEFAAQYGVKLPGYDVTNARLDWEDIRGTGLDLSVFVRNLFDKEYYTAAVVMIPGYATNRSDEHTSEIQSLMRRSYAVLCLKKKI